ncbi:PRC-barrel domain-containing protein [Rhodocytophaga aerolata]|uniref:PRC-barrel domain-containing protein n=1 Tax=Rhodocytophaga aerolata TaxID=455078 RepID=A0ABT8R2Y4_9BACT|nr:PRC-barrel domain-containing protein [Rhodocytophaga aerolata]MDO1446466.1 PRC-barrel domain-containing protein [Rhodocytophaga aerolata]
MNEQSQDLSASNMSGQNQEGSNANWPVKTLTATSMIGDGIENLQGEHLGKIKDLMVDLESGSITYVVIEYGGFLGMGEKLFALPLKALKLDQVNRKFTLNIDRALFEKAPGFDKHHWPATNSHEYFQEVGSYWGSFMGANTGGKAY